MYVPSVIIILKTIVLSLSIHGTMNLFAWTVDQRIMIAQKRMILLTILFTEVMYFIGMV